MIPESEFSNVGSATYYKGVRMEYGTGAMVVIGDRYGAHLILGLEEARGVGQWLIKQSVKAEQDEMYRRFYGEGTP